MEAQHVTVQQHIGKDHCDKGRDHAPMHARSGDQLGIMRAVIGLQVARAGKAEPFGVFQQPQRDRGQHLLGHIDQHQRHEDFIGAKAHFQKGRDHRPDPAAESSGQYHQREDVPRIQRVKGQPDARAEDGAHDVLSFGPDVPDTGAKAQRQADGD